MKTKQKLTRGLTVHWAAGTEGHPTRASVHELGNGWRVGAVPLRGEVRTLTYWTMIELRAFVKEALTEIVEGVRDAQEALKGTGAIINAPKHAKILSWHIEPTTVEFDVAVTTSETGGSRTGVGIFVGALGGGAQTTDSTGINASSRIKFAVPVRLPATWKRPEFPPKRKTTSAGVRS